MGSAGPGSPAGSADVLAAAWQRLGIKWDFKDSLHSGRLKSGKCSCPIVIRTDFVKVQEEGYQS